MRQEQFYGVTIGAEGRYAARPAQYVVPAGRPTIVSRHRRARRPEHIGAIRPVSASAPAPAPAGMEVRGG